MATTFTYEPDYISPPGETLEDVLDDRGMTQAELAERTGLARKTVNEIIKGKAPISPDTALHLERVFDIPARFWTSREQQFRGALARLEERERLQQCLDWLNAFPINKMAEMGWIEKPSDKVDQLRELLGFFGVASPEQWKAVWLDPDVKVAFRKSLKFTSEPQHVSAWLRYGDIAARELDCAPYNEKSFRSALKEIRELTREEPEDSQPRMQSLCRDAGVAVVLTPQLPKAKICGATRWLRPDCALMQLSDRYKTDDHFWFTFFHEAGHILLHGKKDVFLEECDDEHVQEKEDEANEFAARFLISPSALQELIDSGARSYAEVDTFAEEIGIAPGIVVGQLQRRGYLPYSHLNGLKQRIAWAT